MESRGRKSKTKVKREKEKRGFAFISWICKRCFRTADNSLVVDSVLLLEAAADADEDAESVCRFISTGIYGRRPSSLLM